MTRSLSPDEANVLETLAPGTLVKVPELSSRLELDQAKVAAAAVTLAEDGWVEIQEEPYTEWKITEAGRAAVADGIVERRVLLALLAHEGSGSMAEVPGWAGLEPKEVGQSLRGLGQRGWVKKDGGTLTVTEVGEGAESTPGPDEEILQHLAQTGGCLESELAAFDLPAANAFFGKKSALVDVRSRIHRSLLLTASGEEYRSGAVVATREVNQLTPELLASGEWKNVKFRPYDIDLGTEPIHPGKKHPLQRVIESTRHSFLTMGFEEAASSYVESGFWDFDALFQPQDHPAREMQDTFYVGTPNETPLPTTPGLVDRVRAVHENGGETGSVGWRYKWDPQKAMQNVLRTHTTATTIRSLAENPVGPRKVFSIGRVFRRETIDYKHLPIFFQVDGIIIDKEASFASLLGTLAAFYERMGFKKFTFRPGFFPYTEPSVEVFIWHEEKQDWFEMGGAGIFRPEVTEPLGCTEPVLAWGLGLDRLAMLLHDRSDIRDLYLSDLEWLRAEPRCR